MRAGFFSMVRADPWSVWIRGLGGSVAWVDPWSVWIRGPCGSVVRVDPRPGGSVVGVEIGRFWPGRSVWPISGRVMKNADFRPVPQKSNFHPVTMAYVFLPPLRFFELKPPLRFFGRKHPYVFCPP